MLIYTVSHPIASDQSPGCEAPSERGIMATSPSEGSTFSKSRKSLKRLFFFCIFCISNVIPSAVTC